MRTQATIGDAQRLYQLLTEASAWLRDKGIGQWNTPYPAHRFRSDIEGGRVWYWAPSGTPIATATLREHCPEYYGPGAWADEIAAWYISRFTVARRLAGERVGERVLAQIEADAAGAGVQALRLDVVASNPFLETYYVARGFRRYQAIDIFGEPAVLLEKRLGQRP